MEMSRQRELLQKAAKNMRDRYICADKMLLLLLAKSAEGHRGIVTIDYLYQSFETSMQFGQYRRALRYLIALQRCCEKTLGAQAIDQRLTRLEKELNAGGQKQWAARSKSF